MGMVSSKEKDQRRRIEGLGACSLRWSQLEQAHWLVLTAFGRAKQQQLDQQHLHCSVFMSLVFIAPLNKLLEFCGCSLQTVAVVHPKGLQAFFTLRSHSCRVQALREGQR